MFSIVDVRRSWLLVLATSAFVGPPAYAAETPCFTPGQDCAAFIVEQIDAAKSELLIQAYGFSNSSIVEAIGNAKARGVAVKTILDKSNEQVSYSGAPYLQNHCIDVLIETGVAIAHNKVMVIDRRHVITGSFNFTRAAQKRNAENVLLISDSPVLAGLYAANWERLASTARPGRLAARVEGSCNAFALLAWPLAW